MHCNALYYLVLSCLVLSCLVLYCIVLYCIVLYCIVLYCFHCIFCAGTKYRFAETMLCRKVAASLLPSRGNRFCQRSSTSFPATGRHSRVTISSPGSSGYYTKWWLLSSEQRVATLKVGKCISNQNTHSTEIHTAKKSNHTHFGMRLPLCAWII